MNYLYIKLAGIVFIILNFNCKNCYSNIEAYSKFISKSRKIENAIFVYDKLEYYSDTSSVQFTIDEIHHLFNYGDTLQVYQFFDTTIKTYKIYRLKKIELLNGVIFIFDDEYLISEQRKLIETRVVYFDSEFKMKDLCSLEPFYYNMQSNMFEEFNGFCFNNNFLFSYIDNSCQININRLLRFNSEYRGEFINELFIDENIRNINILIKKYFYDYFEYSKYIRKINKILFDEPFFKEPGAYLNTFIFNKKPSFAMVEIGKEKINKDSCNSFVIARYSVKNKENIQFVSIYYNILKSFAGTIVKEILVIEEDENNIAINTYPLFETINTKNINISNLIEVKISNKKNKLIVRGDGIYKLYELFD